VCQTKQDVIGACMCVLVSEHDGFEKWGKKVLLKSSCQFDNNSVSEISYTVR